MRSTSVPPAEEATTQALLRSAARSHMLDDVSRILALRPEDRLIELRNASRLWIEARRVPPDAAV